MWRPTEFKLKDGMPCAIAFSKPSEESDHLTRAIINILKPGEPKPIILLSYSFSVSLSKNKILYIIIPKLLL